MEQVIEQDLWNEFEQELKKVKKISVNLVSKKIISKSLNQFWLKFLNEDFPTGKINRVLEKNFAIYIVINQIDIEKIKEIYKKQNWAVDGLIGYIRMVANNELTNFNILELLKWANEIKIDEYISLLENAKSEIFISESIKILDDEELDKYQETPSAWICENLLKKGTINILGGKRSTMKSWISLNIAYSICSGKNFLIFKCEQGNVLILDKENGWDELKKRKALIKKGLDIEKIKNIHFISETTLKLDNSSELDYLEQLINIYNISLIIVDTYRRFICFEENDANLTSRFLVDMIKPICERTKVAFLFIHHEKKGEEGSDDMDKLRGSSDFANLVDGIIQIKRMKNKLIFNQTKLRGKKELEPFEAEIQTDEKTYFILKYLGNTISQDQRIVNLLKNWLIGTKFTKFTYSEGLDYIQSKGFGKTNYVQALKLLESEGLISKGEGFRSPYNVSNTLRGELI